MHASKAPYSRLSSQARPPNQPAEGSGLLGASQLSLRTECACQLPPYRPGHARLRTRAFPHKPSEPASRRLWTAGSITALSACGARLPALSTQARAREAPYSRISPQALSNLKSPFPLPPSRQNTTLRSRPCPAPSRRPPNPNRGCVPKTTLTFQKPLYATFYSLQSTGTTSRQIVQGQPVSHDPGLPSWHGLEEIPVRTRIGCSV
jgi:hypothetical protein